MMESFIDKWVLFVGLLLWAVIKIGHSHREVDQIEKIAGDMGLTAFDSSTSSDTPGRVA
jgi:hypothetical protein